MRCGSSTPPRIGACRSRSATWSGSTPPCSSSVACSSAGWLSTVYAIVSRRAGPFPARIRDVGVTIDLATHDVDILSWIAGERPTSVFAELAQRKHADHEDLLFGLLHFPSGATGMLDVNWLTPAKRRQLVVVGEEGHVRARLPDPAAHVHPIGRRPPADDRRLCADIHRRGRRAAGRERRTTRRRTGRVHQRDPRRVAADHQRESTDSGRWRWPAACSRPARTASRST